MTDDQCEACPFPDQTAALELVRLREGIGRLADWWAKASGDGGYDIARRDGARELRALLDDNEGER